MSAFREVRLVRLILVATASVRALGWALAAGLAFVACSALIDVGTPLPVWVREMLLAAASLAFAVTAGGMALRDRRVVALPRVALWIEERVPGLNYALVTAVEAGRDDLLIPESGQWWRMASRLAGRAVVPPTAVVACLGAAMFLLPPGALARVRMPHAGDALDRGSAGSAGSAAAESHLHPLVARIAAPTYLGSETSPTIIDEPRDVRAPVGGVLTLSGRGDAQGIVARVSGTFPRDVRSDLAVQARVRGDGWEIEVPVSRSMAVELDDRHFRRLVVVESVADSAPRVTLVMPAHDSVLRRPAGRIALTATADDDHGVRAAWFEYVISSGDGEAFVSRSGKLGSIAPNARHASLTASVLLESLGIKAGDVVHLRAAASDANDVSGPGIGVSETRSLRIARAGDYDSVSVEAAAPSEADRGVVSQRMLIQLAQTLEKERGGMPRDAVVSASRRIAGDERALRRTVGDLVFSRLGGAPDREDGTDEAAKSRATTMEQMLARADAATNRSRDPIDFGNGESPVVAVNKPLLDAYNAMWNATTELELGEPGRAIPHMTRALLAIQKARRAERVYPHGTATAIVIDVDDVRLRGKDTGTSGARRPGVPIEVDARGRRERLAAIVDLLSRDRAAAVDSVLTLRVDAVGDNPELARALGAAAAAMGRGNAADAARALSLARHALGPAPTVRDSLSRWAGLRP